MPISHERFNIATKLPEHYSDDPLSNANLNLLPEMPGGVQPQATPAGGTFRCQYGTTTDGLEWSFIASQPASYVIGESRDGWNLKRTMKSAYVASEGRYYDGGYIDNNFNGCGWVAATNDVQINSNNTMACQSPSYSPSDFASIFNCAPTQCNDGTPVTTTGVCTVWFNMRPWVNNPNAGTEYAYNQPPGYTGFRWQYLTKYSYYGQRWAMVRDTGIAQGAGNWSFVPETCLQGPLPPGPGGYWQP